MGPLRGAWWYLTNLARAGWRLLLSPRHPTSIPKRLDQFVGAIFGLHYKATISAAARWHREMLWTDPLAWVTNLVDPGHLDRGKKPYPPGPGMRYFVLGVILVGVTLRLAGCA